MSLDSGAVAYSHTGSRRSGASRSRLSILAISSVDRVVVGTLVPAGSLLVDLHQHVVQERGRPDAEEVWRHPLRAERLVHQHQVLDGLLGLTDAAGHLDADPPARLMEELPGRLHHAQR